MQARLFSYLDTQLTRLGGPNFTQLPINRPHCPVNDMLRDGMHQTAIHAGLAPYRPNSIDGGEPLVAEADEGGYVPTPRPVDGPVVRAQPVSFDDHFTQPAMFYRSLSEVEKAHVIEAFTFELGKCYEQAVKERELEVLANVDADLCQKVADGLGLPAPKGNPPTDVRTSAALSQIVTQPGPIAGRKVAVIADAGSDLAGIATLTKALKRFGAEVLVTAPVGGTLKSGRRSVVVERTNATARSIEFDAVIVSGGTTVSDDIKLVVLLQEAFRHCKPLGAWGSGAAQLKAATIDLESPGVLLGGDVDKAFGEELIKALGLHRVWARAADVMASSVAPSKTSPRTPPAKKGAPAKRAAKKVAKALQS
jgi:catalase